MSWVKRHARRVDVLRGKTTVEDKIGNEGAEELAQAGTRLHQVSPEVVNVIHQNPLAIPNFLRSAKNLTPEQWEMLQQQVEEMTEKK